jgi:hypothetical protein
MNLKSLLVAAGAAALLVNVGCLRSYNVSPLSPASLSAIGTTESGLEIRSKAFLNPGEVSDKFGTKLGTERQVIPVQVMLSNKGKDSFRILRTSFVIEELNKKIRLESLNNDQMYELGRHGYGAPVCGIIFGGILGLPSLITTITSNEKLREDYSRKTFVDAIVEPGKEVSGSLMFDPAARQLSRTDKYKLVVELENITTRSKATVEQVLN